MGRSGRDQGEIRGDQARLPSGEVRGRSGGDQGEIERDEARLPSPHRRTVAAARDEEEPPHLLG